MRSAEIVGFFLNAPRVKRRSRTRTASYIPSAIFTAARASNAVES